MKLDKFISQSLTHIITGMRDFQRSEQSKQKGDARKTEHDPTYGDEGASVFPQLSGKSGELSNPGLMKAAKMTGHDGRSTIMAINYEVLISVSGDAIGVVEGSVKLPGLFDFKARAEAKYKRDTIQRLSFTIPLDLPLPLRERSKEKRGMHTVDTESYDPLDI